MNAFVNAIRAVSKACGVAAALLVGSAILVVCQMVVLRYLLKASTVWQTEYVVFALVGATLIGSPYVLMIKGHVNVDLLPMYLGKRGRMALAYLSALAGLACSGLLAWSGFELFAEAL